MREAMRHSSDRFHIVSLGSTELAPCGHVETLQPPFDQVPVSAACGAARRRAQSISVADPEHMKIVRQVKRRRRTLAQRRD